MTVFPDFDTTPSRAYCGGSSVAFMDVWSAYVEARDLDAYDIGETVIMDALSPVGEASVESIQAMGQALDAYHAVWSLLRPVRLSKIAELLGSTEKAAEIETQIAECELDEPQWVMGEVDYLIEQAANADGAALLQLRVEAQALVALCLTMRDAVDCLRLLCKAWEENLPVRILGAQA